MILLPIVLEQSLMLLPLVLGMYLSFKILRVTDLTVDGTYVLGAAIFAKSYCFGILFALLLSFIGGGIVGVIVSYMQRRDIVNNLIVGILASFMLYSVNFQILGRPNYSLIDKPTLLNILRINSWILVLSIIAIALLIALTCILKSKLGLFLKAFGSNRKLLSMLGKSPERYRSIGLSLSNGLASLTGALAAQINGFADINMGIGVALVSIGAIIMGEQFSKPLRRFDVIGNLLGCFFGITLYFSMLNLLLGAGIEPTNLKLLLGLGLFLIMKKMPNKVVL